MVRLALVLWALMSIYWAEQVPNPAHNYIAAFFDIAAAVAVDAANTRWHQRRAAR
jgi:hypothetical protein